MDDYHALILKAKDAEIALLKHQNEINIRMINNLKRKLDSSQPLSLQQQGQQQQDQRSKRAKFLMKKSYNYDSRLSKTQVRQHYCADFESSELEELEKNYQYFYCRNSRHYKEFNKHYFNHYINLYYHESSCVVCQKSTRGFVCFTCLYDNCELLSDVLILKKDAHTIRETAENVLPKIEEFVPFIYFAFGLNARYHITKCMLFS